MASKTYRRLDGAKNVLEIIRISDDRLLNNGCWPASNHNSTWQTRIKRRSGYKPECPTTLVKPVLLTRFNRWSGQRYSKQKTSSLKSMSRLPGLETNLFAQILLSPTRMEASSRSILPAETMIKLGVVESDDPQHKLLLTHLQRKRNVPGPRCYVLGTQRMVSAVKEGKLRSMLLAMRSDRSVNLADRGLYGTGVSWRPDAVVFSRQVLLHDVMRSAHILAGALSEPVLSNGPTLALSWSPTVELEDMRCINVPAILGDDGAKALKRTLEQCSAHWKELSFFAPLPVGNDLQMALWRFQNYD